MGTFDTGNTTSPAPREDDATHRADADDIFVVVICQAALEPGREGELVQVHPNPARPTVVGRDMGTASFLRQVPGDQYPTGPLRGDLISGEQVVFTSAGTHVRVHNVGRAVTYVNGTELPEGYSTLVPPGSVVTLNGHSVLLVTRRRRTIPRAADVTLPPHDFGDRCAYLTAGESPEAYRLREEIARAGKTGKSAVVYGPSGTGKELVARGIHAASSRRRGPFIVVNCPGLEGDLAAHQLFGGRKNYPNPGTDESIGFFGAAAGGYVFLDELGQLAISLQANLLRALMGHYNRTGYQELTPVRCGILAATNSGPDGVKFDVHWRFEHHIYVPSLAERREDIAQIMRALLLDMAAQDEQFAKWFLRHSPAGRPYVPVHQSLIGGLLRSPLTGNVRELGHILRASYQQALYAASDEQRVLRWPTSKYPFPERAELKLLKEDSYVPTEELVQGVVRGRPQTVPAPKMEEEPEFPSAARPLPSKARVLEALDRCEWHFGKAAAMLDISEDQLYRLRIKYGLHDPNAPR